MIEILGIDFHVYGLLIGLSVVAGYKIAIRVARVRGMAEEILTKLSWWVVGLGVIGARGYHVIDLWGEYYSNNLFNILFLWNGGLGIWGGVIGGGLGLIIFNLAQDKFVINKTLLLKKTICLSDVVIVGMPLGQVIGRLGNFFNQELYGKITNLPWSIYITQTGQRHHPLFAYEATLNSILFVFLWKNRKIKKNGWLTGVYLCGYSAIRILLEPLRPTEIVWKAYNLPVASLMGIVIFSLGMVLIFWSQKQCYKPHSYYLQNKA